MSDEADAQYAQQQKAFAAAQAAAQQRAQAESGAYGRAASYDPAAAVDKFAQGAWSQAQAGIKQDLGDLRGAEVGAGRLDTGFYDYDQGQVMKSAIADYNSKIAQTAVQASGQTVQNNQALLGASEHANTDYMDMVSGGLDRATREKEYQDSQPAWWEKALDVGTKVAGTVAMFA